MTALRGASVLLTGASSGLGRAAAFALARRGARLTVTGRDPDRLAETAEQVGAVAIPADLADPASTGRLLEALDGHGCPDVVVHNAGLGLVVPAAETGEEHLRRLLRVNLAAPVEITRALLPGMQARGRGHLVFVTSVAAHLGVPEESGYAATKAALSGYAASLRAELGRCGIVVSTFAPGIVDTEFFARRGAPYARRLPRPLPASRVAAELVRCIETDRAEVVVPRWLRVPVALRAAAPGLYSRLERRWL